jgi:hypothetical protein
MNTQQKAFIFERVAPAERRLSWIVLKEGFVLQFNGVIEI